MPIQSAEAIILRHLDYGEADRIVTFLTPEHGVKKGFARSARNSRKRFGAALEPYASVRMHWRARGGELLTLREAELLDLRAGLRADLAALALAAYGCELTEELFWEAHGHREVFALLAAYLDHLASAGGEASARLLLELRLLNLAGYVPHLLHCSECNVTLTPGGAAFAAGRGGSLCRSCAGSGPARTVALGTLGSLARSLLTPPTAFAGFRFSPQTLGEGSALLAEALRLHLHRPLRTLAFLNEVLPPPAA
ncbi:MAG TPA: DNA repair protein RecO [Desulfuromonas sp.]|nr:DNA repair protein RecO [Desulfuromonas sp.]